MKGRTIAGAGGEENQRHNCTSQGAPLHGGEWINLKIMLERPFRTGNESEKNERVKITGKSLLGTFDEVRVFSKSGCDGLGRKRVPMTILKVASIARKN